MSDTPLNGIIALLNDALLNDHIGVVEVLAQEGMTNLSLPTGVPDFGELASLYGQRVRLGAHGPVDDPTILVAWGADFILPDFLSPNVATTVVTLKVACYASAMIPNETSTALEMPVTGMQSRPTGAVGPAMVEHPWELRLISRVVPRSGLISLTTKQWLKAGFPVVCMDQHLIGDALTGDDLAALRDRCRNLAQKNTNHGLTARVRQSPWGRHLRSRGATTSHLRDAAADPAATPGHACEPE